MPPTSRAVAPSRLRRKTKGPPRPDPPPQRMPLPRAIPRVAIPRVAIPRVTPGATPRVPPRARPRTPQAALRPPLRRRAPRLPRRSSTDHDKVFAPPTMKRYLIAGLLVWVPLGITIWVITFLVSTLDQTLLLVPTPLRPEALVGFHIP